LDSAANWVCVSPSIIFDMNMEVCRCMATRSKKPDLLVEHIAAGFGDRATTFNFSRGMRRLSVSLVRWEIMARIAARR